MIVKLILFFFFFQIKAVTKLLKRNNLSKTIKSVMAEQLLCAYNISGRNGRKALKSFPQFFSVLIGMYICNFADILFKYFSLQIALVP